MSDGGDAGDIGGGVDPGTDVPGDSPFRSIGPNIDNDPNNTEAGPGEPDEQSGWFGRHGGRSSRDTDKDDPAKWGKGAIAGAVVLTLFVFEWAGRAIGLEPFGFIKFKAPKTNEWVVNPKNDMRPDGKGPAPFQAGTSIEKTKLNSWLADPNNTEAAVDRSDNPSKVASHSGRFVVAYNGIAKVTPRGQLYSEAQVLGEIDQSGLTQYSPTANRRTFPSPWAEITGRDGNMTVLSVAHRQTIIEPGIPIMGSTSLNPASKMLATRDYNATVMFNGEARSVVGYMVAVQEEDPLVSDEKGARFLKPYAGGGVFPIINIETDGKFDASEASSLRVRVPVSWKPSKFMTWTEFINKVAEQRRDIGARETRADYESNTELRLALEYDVPGGTLRSSKEYGGEARLENGRVTAMQLNEMRARRPSDPGLGL